MRFFYLLILLPLWAWALEPLDINTATADQILQATTGIGKIKAEAIVKDRETRGPFKSIDDLARVFGIGQKTIEKNREALTVKIPKNP